MTPFFGIPVLMQNTVCFWAIVVCLGGLADAMLLLRQKRYPLCALSCLCFALGYFLVHVCREGTELRLNGYAAESVLYFLNRPFVFFLLALVSASAVCVWAYVSVQKWKRTHITPASIKESLDALPAGICYYSDEGQCVLVNHRMKDIAFSLSGQSLQNGADFYELVKDKGVHTLSDGTAVAFRHRVISYGGAPLHELIADDITELYEKSEELRRDNEKARQLAASMKSYGETIADTVRRQEILQAKVNIHDEMNRMILATKKTSDGAFTEKERRNILQMWRAQALLLCKEADTGRSSNVVSDLNALADAIGLRLMWQETPKTGDARVLTLFLSAAREAMANAVKHAGAAMLHISVRESDAAFSASFSNDGSTPACPITESGGLETLRRRIEDAGGQMLTDTSDGFSLSFTVPKEDTPYAI